MEPLRKNNGVPFGARPEVSRPSVQISLRATFLVMLFAAIGVAGWAANNRTWSAVLTNLNVATLVAAAVTAIYAQGNARGFSIGFLLGNGAITLLEFIPEIGRPLIQRMLAWTLWARGADTERAYVGALLTGWIYGCLAGWLAIWLRQKFATAAPDDDKPHDGDA